MLVLLAGEKSGGISPQKLLCYGKIVCVNSFWVKVVNMDESKEIILDLKYSFTFYARRVAPGGAPRGSALKTHTPCSSLF